MFHVYVVRDLVEVEPVYFPTNTTSQRQDPKYKIKEKNNKVEDSEEEEKETPYRVPLESILIHRLTERYVGRVLVPQGLSIAIHSVLDYSSGEVKGAAGSAWYTVLFSLCVFRPLPETRLHATIQRQVPEGLELELPFFTSSSSSSSSAVMMGGESTSESLSLAPLTGFPFYVPKEELVKGSAYDEKRKCWYLPIDINDSDDNNNNNNNNQTSVAIKKEKGEEEEKEKGKSEKGSDTKNRNDYRIGETVLVRVVQCIVRDKHDDHHPLDAITTTAADGTHTAAMELIGSFEGGSGLGPVEWYGE